MLPLFLVSQLWLYLGNSQVSVYRTIGPLVLVSQLDGKQCYFSQLNRYGYCSQKGKKNHYPWSGVRHPSVFAMLKHLLLRNGWANQSQILCGASFGRGNEFVLCIWVTWPRWPPRPYMVKPFKNLFRNQ